jgi:hypothetical protein
MTLVGLGRRGLPWLGCLALMGLECAPGGDRDQKPVLHMEEPIIALPPPPAGWPYWAPVPVEVRAAPVGMSLPLAPSAIERPGGAAARWADASPDLRAAVLRDGFAIGRPKALTVSVGAFYEGLRRDDVPSLVTIDTLFAVSTLAINAALADAEVRVTSRAMSTLLHRLDARLALAEPGARPDLIDGIHVAEALVAVALVLADPAYVPPPEVKDAVIEEAVLVRSHPGVTVSRILHVPIDYTAFTPQGALTRDAEVSGAYLAAQWLSRAQLSFDGGESSGVVDMSAARSRTRAALLIARLVMASADADLPARRALSQLDRLDELVFGPAAAASPLKVAELVAAKGFDLHDAKVITDAAPLDQIRRSALAGVQGMAILPLREAPESRLFAGLALEDAGPGARATDVVTWLASTGAPAGHASCYASGLSAIVAWEGPSRADPAEVFTRSPAWQQRKRGGALSAWTSLRHAGIAYARTTARPAVGTIASEASGSRPSPVIVVEPHPEAIAAQLSLVRQVMLGLTALEAIDKDAPSYGLLVEAESILDIALTAAREEAAGRSEFTARAAELRGIGPRLAAMEARTSPGAGPFAVVVHRDDRTRRALLEGTTGLLPLYAVVADPRSGRPLLAVGAIVAHAETTLADTEPETDQAWAERLAAPHPPPADPFPVTIEEP